MALTILTQPIVDSLQAAYRPIYFEVMANQAPASSDPCTIVFCDIYVDTYYIGTISSTVYEDQIGPYYVHQFDIQDKIQEYLFSEFPLNANPYILNKHAGTCYVRFRDTYIDAGGFTVSNGTEPILGTKYTSPVDGGGIQSNSFVVLNSSLQHEENQSLETHLKNYTGSPLQIGIGYNLSHRPNIDALGNQIAGGKYHVCLKDHDVLPFFTFDDISTATVGLYGTYVDGTTFSVTTPASTFTSANNTSYFFDGGPAYLQTLFPAILWNNVSEYDVEIYGFIATYVKQHYVINRCGCCDERIRLFFLNRLGGYDAVNFTNTIITNKTESGVWQKSLPLVQSSKKDKGISRFQVLQNDYYQTETYCYGEKSQNWLKELFGSAVAYIQWDGIEGQPNDYLPIVIEDYEFIPLKNDERYEYATMVKFNLSNEQINLRS